MNPELLTKVAIFAGAFLAVLLISRLAGHVSSRQEPLEPPPPLRPDAGLDAASPPAPASADGSHPEPVMVPPSLRTRDGSPLELRGYYFDHCDVRVAPPDPEVFCDDLHLDVCDPRTGNAWQPAFTIATPRGLARQLEQNNWDYMEGDAMLIVPRFSLDAVLKCALQRVTENLDAGSDPQNEDSQVPLT